MAEYQQFTISPIVTPENTNIFIIDEDIGVFPDGIYDGQMGSLPLLATVSVGYHPEDHDPYMHYYESQEILFAYKKGAQKRVLMRDSQHRTLSLPLHTTLTFRLGADTQQMTMAELVSSRRLPVSAVQFARAECLDFTVNNRAANHHFFGSLTVIKDYEEPYLWCLSVQPNGKIGNEPIVLPRNLKQAGFCPVVGIQGATDPSAKLKEVLRNYAEVARQLPYEGDPFFQELAIVSHGPDPVMEIEPYIDQTTFIPIHVTRRPVPQAPSGEPPPPPPPRKPLCSQSSAEEDQGQGSYYSSISDRDLEEHTYSVPQDSGVSKPATGVPKAFPQPRTDSRPSAEYSSRQPPPLPDKSSHGRLLMSPFSAGETCPDDEHPRLPERKNLPPKPGSSGDPQDIPVNLMAPPKIPLRAVRSHLSSLSIEDVGLKLKELGLEKYVKKFRKNRIDGVLLQRVTEEDLKAEFSMGHMEFLLLDTFIKDGHIPQTEKSKSPAKKSSF